MFSLEPERTQYDLSWQMFGIPVRVHPMFWLLSLFLGWDLSGNISILLMWVVCVFVSILIHELGHVLMGQLFGTRGHIVLYAFGGLAIGSNALSNRWKRIAVCFAGPLAGFLFLGLVLVGIRFLDPRELSPLAREALGFLFWINLVWGILNLFPIWPLDGGQISRDFLDWLVPRNGIFISLGLSGVTAALLAIIMFVYTRSLYNTLMFGLLAYSSFQAMQQTPRGRSPWDDDDRSRSWDRDRSSWDRD